MAGNVLRQTNQLLYGECD